MKTLVARWRRSVSETAATLSALSDETARRRPAEGKWSVKEILGHLVDSASNNHRRFVLAQFRDGLVFDGYEQEQWVAAGRYQEAAWPALVTLWAGMNNQLSHLAAGIPREILDKPQTDHNFYDIASRYVPKGEPTTLGFFIEDYVYHLDHHLAQIRALVKQG